MFLVRSLHSVTGDFPASHVWLPEGSIKPLSSISCWRVVSCGLSGFAAFYSRYVWEREEHVFQRGTRDWSSCIQLHALHAGTYMYKLYIYISLSHYSVLFCASDSSIVIILEHCWPKCWMVELCFTYIVVSQRRSLYDPKPISLIANHIAHMISAFDFVYIYIYNYMYLFTYDMQTYTYACFVQHF